ncbi:D-alanine--D-alanine ligase family protein [Frateuria aurantia]
MSEKIVVGVLFGGCSPEHDISWQSVRYVMDGLDRAHYQPVLIHIDRQGRWSLADERVLTASEARREARVRQGLQLMLLPGGGGALVYPDWTAAHRDLPRRIDIAFPVLHGPGGEDGALQGVLEQAAVAYVGSGVRASAICLDKVTCRRLLRDAGLPVLPYLSVRDGGMIDYTAASTRLHSHALMVKPAGQGSSAGVSRVESGPAFDQAVAWARGFGHELMIEPALPRPRELEIGMLEAGPDDLRWSAIGEIRLHRRYEFYSYAAKYQDPEAATLELPAILETPMAQQLQSMAVKACQVLGCEGLARVDFLLASPRLSDLYINEVNTIPGLTSHSLYPKLWQEQGLTERAVIDRLLQQALRRQARDRAVRPTPGLSRRMTIQHDHLEALDRSVPH